MNKFAENVEKRMACSRENLRIIYQDIVHADVLKSCRSLKLAGRTSFFHAQVYPETSAPHTKA